MSTSTLGLVALDVDLDVNVECGYCNQPAAWVGVLSPCNHSGLTCTYHHATDVATLTLWPEDSYCNACDAHVGAVEWRPL